MSTKNQRAVSAFFASLLLSGAAAIAGAQSNPSSPDQSTPPQQKGKPLVITGCVIADRERPDQFTVQDTKAGVTYRVYGVKVYDYVGRRVRIVGGLYPSANVAAQAGAIDPTKAAIAASSTGTAALQLPEIRVTQVRGVKGSCSPGP